MAPSKDLTDDLRLAHVLADNADSITMARFRAADLVVTSKPDLSHVTDADTAVEGSAACAHPAGAIHGEGGRHRWGHGGG
jgi:histidinol-phosphatase